MSSTYWAAAFVPVRAGFTASARPCTTHSWNASFTYGDELAVPHSRSSLVSFSVKSSTGCPSHRRTRSPTKGWSTATVTAPPADSAPRSCPFGPPSHHVLRNHSEG